MGILQYPSIKNLTIMKLTIFTPTYNRAYILPKLYNSLKNQSNLEFEWLIVDDGSSDNTEELVKSFLAEHVLDIRYYKKENGGKHRAINYAVNLAKGNFFFIVDSDDYLPQDSVSIILNYISQIEYFEDFAGVSGNRCYPDGSVVGGDVSYDVLDTDTVSIREKYHVKGDMAEIWRTSILRQYPFPEFPGEKFMTEGIVWSEISRKYILRYFNQNIYICDYLQDGLTKNIRKHHRKSPLGSMYIYAKYMKDERYSIMNRIKSAINYWRYTIPFKGKRDGEFSPVWWSYVFYPVAIFFYYKDLK